MLRNSVIFCTLILCILLNFLTRTLPLNFNINNTKGDLNILCFNVHSLDSLYRKNQLKIAENILKERPDIVFLSEFHLYKNRQLDSILSKEYRRYYKLGTLSAFYSKFEMDSIVEVFPLWGKTRHSQTVKSHVFCGKDTFSIIGCHLSSSHHHIMEGFKRRKKEADILHENIRKDIFPVIVIGDLNDISGSYTLYKIEKAGLVNAWWEGGWGYGTTFHDGWIRLRLDHILYQKNRLKLQSIKVIDSNLSDHNALVASFNVIKRMF